MNGITLEKLQVIIEAQTQDLRNELAKVKQQLTSTSAAVKKETGKIGNSFGGMMKKVMGLVGITAVVTSLKKVGSAAIEMASDLQEVQNVVDTAFGDMAYMVENFSKKAIDQFGMSELTAKRTASTYMAMSKGMGIAGDKAAKMAISVAGLTGDVASFYNVSQSVADTALKSIWTGETESLKQFGVVMTQTNLQQFAYSKGIQKTIADMDQAEQTTLRYMYVTEQLSLAQGDFSKTSGSWANQIRILQERWKQMLGIIGNGLVQVLTPVIQFINMIVSKLLWFAQVLQSVFRGLFGGGKADPVAGAAASASKAESAQNGYTNSLKKSDAQAKKNQKTLAGFDEINNINQPQSGAEGADMSGLGGDGFAIDFGDLGLDEEPDTSGIEKAAEKIRNIIKGVLDFLDENKAKILAIMGGVAAFLIALKWPAIAAAIGKIVMPLKKAFDWLKAFMSLASSEGIIGALKAAFLGFSTTGLIVAAVIGAVVAAVIYLWNTSDEFRNNVMAVVEGLMSVLNQLWQGVLVPIGNFILDLIDNVIMPLVNIIAQAVCAVVLELSGVLSALWVNILQPIAEFIVGVLSVCFQGLYDIWVAMLPAINEMMAILQTIWVDTLQPIAAFIADVLIVAIQLLGTIIQTVLTTAQTMFNKLVTFLTGTFAKSWETVWGGCKTVFATIWNTIIDIIETAVNFIIDAINWCIDQINKIHIDVPGWVTALTGMTTFGFNIARIERVSLPRIEMPKLANGGLAYGPTTAIVGDNPGASSDPEVIAPLSKLQNLMGFGSAETLNALNRLYDILLMIYEKDDTVIIDGESLADRINRINKDNDRRRGNPAFALER